MPHIKFTVNDYRERVERLARERTGEPIFNGSLEHASIIVESMFARATDQISILSEKLNPRVYGRDEVIEQARLFLANGQHTLRILIEDDDEKGLRDHPFFDEFARHDKIEVKSVPGDWLPRYKFHLLVMDDDSYRFEPDKKKYEAIAAFGDSKGAKNIKSIFDTLWETGNRMTLPQLVMTA